MTESTDTFIRIPHPKKFPADSYCRIEDYPDAITDHNILDIQADIPKGVEIQVLAFPLLGEVITKVSSKILSEPQYIGKVDIYDFFACLTEEGEFLFMQTRYYQYFKDRYPGCKFVCSGKCDPVGVMQDDKVVGLFMPLIVPEEIVHKISKDMTLS